MKPKNEKEINNAFFQFLMLFLLTVAIVVVAVFFDYGFNWKDYGKVKEQYREVSSILNSKNALVSKIDSINSVLVRYDLPGAVPGLLEADISQKITDLNQSSGADSISKKFNSSVYRSFTMLLKSKIDYRKLKDNYDKLDYQNKTLQSDYDKLKEQYDDLNKQYTDIINSRRQ